MITLFHWDLPAALDERYGGLLNKTEFVADFTHYARTVFAAFGDKCKHWITFNEPWCSSILGYSTGLFAPGRTSDRGKNPVGDSSREPWIVGHNILCAHGSAVKVYREEFKARDGGEIGITLNGRSMVPLFPVVFLIRLAGCISIPPRNQRFDRLTVFGTKPGDWVEPYDSSSEADIAACERKLEFSIAWFSDPIYHGDYPLSMIAQLGDRLPRWTEEDIALVKGSNDFYGMNHYCANYIRDLPGTPPAEDFLGGLETLFENNKGEKIGPDTQSFWLKPNPQGFRKLLKWISDRNGKPKILVTENGTSVKGENDLGKEEILEDEFRVEYFRGYVKAMAEAHKEDGVDVRAYMAWSLME